MLELRGRILRAAEIDEIEIRRLDLGADEIGTAEVGLTDFLQLARGLPRIQALRRAKVWIVRIANIRVRSTEFLVVRISLLRYVVSFSFFVHRMLLESVPLPYYLRVTYTTILYIYMHIRD